MSNNIIIGGSRDLIAVDSGGSSNIRVNFNRFKAGTSSTLPSSLIRSTVTGGGNEVIGNVATGTWSDLGVKALNGTVFKGAVTQAPEGVITAGIGSIARLTTASNYTEYVKQTGTGNTGWVARA